MAGSFQGAELPDIQLVRQLARDQLVSHLENVSFVAILDCITCLKSVQASCNLNSKLMYLYYRPLATPTFSVIFFNSDSPDILGFLTAISFIYSLNFI